MGVPGLWGNNIEKKREIGPTNSPMLAPDVGSRRKKVVGTGERGKYIEGDLQLLSKTH